VQAYLNKKQKDQPKVKINESLQRQITKMISMRLEELSEEERSDSNYSEDE